ncbi:MAG: choice-of-anchor A family protein, partial [Clostridia bacterium]|nr:choice-of-anchor A family protein [Clostridia bacterium]
MKFNFLNNRRFKSIISVLLSSCLVFSNLSVIVNAALDTSSETYGKSITIENVLTDFSYFIGGDAVLTNHTVGSVVVGGDAKFGNGGQGSTVPSYFGNLVSASDFATNSWIPDEDSRSGVVFVGDYDPSTEATLTGLGAKQNTNYINVSSAMSSLATQSASIATNSTYVCTVDDCAYNTFYGTDNKLGALNINLDTVGSNKTIRIPYNLYKTVSYINFTNNDKDVTAEELGRGGYTISIDGVNDVPISLAFDYAYADPNNLDPGMAIMCLNGNFDSNSNISNDYNSATKLSNYFKNNLSGINKADEGGNQVNLGGMNLMINFPDAKEVYVKMLNGHLVAPNAAVTIDGGNLEGAVIAASITNTSSEAHYYPYYPVGSVPSITFNKFDISGESIKGAKLKLSGVDSNSSSITLDNTNISLPDDGSVISVQNGCIEFLTGSSAAKFKNLPDGTYTLTELEAPKGFQKAKDIVFTVSEGLLTSVISGTDKYSIDDKYLTMIDEVRLCDITFSKIDGSDNFVEGATIKLTGKKSDSSDITFTGDNLSITPAVDGNSLQWSTTNSAVKIKNLVDGTYILSEIVTPTNYDKADDIEFVVEKGELKSVDGTTKFSVADSIIKMVDEEQKCDVTFTKEDSKGAKLNGASLELSTSTSGVTLTTDNISGATATANNNVLSWT